MTYQVHQQAASRALMQEMGLTDTEIERRKKIVGFDPADLERIARALLTNRPLLDKARQLDMLEHIGIAVIQRFERTPIDGFER